MIPKKQELAEERKIRIQAIISAGEKKPPVAVFQVENLFSIKPFANKQREEKISATGKGGNRR